MYLIKKLFFSTVLLAFFCVPAPASASVIDALNLSPFVPLVLDALMMIATVTYEFFVGTLEKPGIIYMLVWLFLGFTLAISLAKMYIPKKWLGFLGISGGGEIAEGKMSAVKIVEHVAKPGFRAVIATLLLLQLKPVFITDWLVSPFLNLGSVYTNAITEQINEGGSAAPKFDCPADIIEKAWISEDACKFLIQPVSDLSHANNQIIKRGFDFLAQGLRGLITLVPHGGEDFMNIVTGIILIFTFVSSNLFMALLIIQGIFNFGMQLILYPFFVLTYVFKPSDKWLDVWPAFGGITKALQQLIVTMIACAFMLCVNLAIIKALFRWNTSVFVVAAGGSAYSNVPSVTNSAVGFGEHSIMWLSSILTFYLMFRIFDITKQQLNNYVGGGNMDRLYNQVKSDTKTAINTAKGLGSKIGKVAGWFKGKK